MTERLDVLAVREYEQNGEKKTAWCRVGVYFPAKGGQPGEGTIQLDANPINGKLVLKVPRPRNDSGI